MPIKYKTHKHFQVTIDVTIPDTPTTLCDPTTPEILQVWASDIMKSEDFPRGSEVKTTVTEIQDNFEVIVDEMTNEEIIKAIRYNDQRFGSTSSYTEQQITRALADRSTINAYLDRSTNRVRAYIR